MLMYCFSIYVQCQNKQKWQIKVKKLHIFHCFYRFCLVVFIRICVLHTALVLFGCISPDMCIAYTLVLSSLVVFIYTSHTRPLFLEVLLNMIKYWVRLSKINTSSTLLSECLLLSEALHKQNKKSWYANLSILM